MISACLIATLCAGGSIAALSTPAPQTKPLDAITTIVEAFRQHFYEELFQTVRAVNARLPTDRRLRVVLGDPSLEMTLAGEPGIAERFASECAAVQGKPDLSGTWTPDPIPPRVEPREGMPPPPPRVLEVTIAQTDTSLKVTRRLEFGGRETLSVSTYKLDGTESVNQTGPLVYRATAAWDGSDLVITSKISADEKPLGSQKEIYRIEGGQLTVESTRQTPVGTMNTSTVHKKSQPSR